MGLTFVLLAIGIAAFVGGAMVERQNRIKAAQNRGRAVGIGAHGALPDTDKLSRIIMSAVSFVLIGAGVLLILWGVLRLFGIF